MIIKIINAMNSLTSTKGIPFAQKEGVIKEVKDIRFWVDDIDLQRRNIRLNLKAINDQNFATGKAMVTSPLIDAKYVNGYEVIYTQNSIYVCEIIA